MKTVFITGTSSGIGRAAAKIFHANGWNVAAGMRTPEIEDEFVAYENLCMIKCDVMNAESVQYAIHKAIEKFGGIDVLVNNAGVYDTKPFELLTEHDFDQIIGPNIKGVITCIQSVLPHFREKCGGVIINVSSVAGFVAFPYQTLYHASKWGLEGLSESLQYELRPLNIKVKIVEPGMVKTNLYDHIFNPKSQIPEAYQQSFKAWHSYLVNNMSKGNKPELSAQIIYKAATDNTGKSRYKSGADTMLATMLDKVLPRPVFRYIVEKMTGLRPKHR